MAKKKSGIVKAAVGIGAVVVAGKVAYEKYKTTKSRYTKEEQDSAQTRTLIQLPISSLPVDIIYIVRVCSGSGTNIYVAIQTEDRLLLRLYSHRFVI